ncbi:YitT family protein [Chitinophaga sp. Cy-1792]|uniref:YitT family protein n=1 Tax=Chitinophaga sp. Cy-1792 TaxID=2608339 RepID=UPI00141F4F38|nr:YitT family protein [Chitinophaga sp. Cy-1792]NIG56862.1 YitT family protein [Chitinophaga sp. Cy-1792]
MKEHIKNILLIVLGAFIFAVGINYLAIPNKLSEGGVIGLTIVTYYYFGWSPGIMNFLINAVLIVVGYRVLDKRTMYYTILGIIFCSLFLYITENHATPVTQNTLLASVFAGLLVGIGIGLVFLSGGTTGGSAILARLVNKFTGLSLGNAMLIFDIIVILISSFIIGIEKTMYTFIAVYIGARTVDFIVDGLNTKRAVTIISQKPELIADRITRELERGCTVLHGHGAYTKEPKEVLYVVIGKQELMRLKALVQESDAEAFLVIHEVHEVLGRGFSM